jgi:RHS repeat-associated protein
MTAAVGARNLFKVDAGVVHALLQARYYDGSKGEFLSEDPVFLGNPNDQDLTNPQTLNSYSYSNDNPITKSDPSGKDAFDYSRPVSNTPYNHAFVYIVPQAGETLPSINSNGMCIDTSQPFTLSAYPQGPSGTWPHLTMRGNDAYDYGIVTGNQSTPGTSMVQVTPPAGMTPAQYDASVVSGFNSLAPDQGLYNPPGWRRTLGISNSNNANTSLVMSGGVGQQQMNGMRGSLNSASGRLAPGLGVSMSANTGVQNVLSSLRSALQSLSATLASLSGR